MTLQERFNTLRPQVALAMDERCGYCGLAWHIGAPQLCIGFQLLGVDFMERLAAKVFNEGWEAYEQLPAVAVWEGEGGR